MALDWRKLLGFPPKYRESTGQGPDFPGSAGDRERGKFRESAYPRLTTVAVVDDEGRPIRGTTDQILEQILLELQALRAGQVASGLAEHVDLGTSV